MDGGRRGPRGPPADRTANTIVAEAALVPRPATAGNTVQARTSLPPIVPEECALVSSLKTDMFRVLQFCRIPQTSVRSDTSNDSKSSSSEI
jgi:hypothetical protein